MIHRAERRDSNERSIIEALQAAKVTVVQMPIGAGFDLLCIKDGIIRIVEVKAQTDYKLTKDESRLRLLLMLQEVPYCIVQSVEDALGLWNLG